MNDLGRELQAIEKEVDRAVFRTIVPVVTGFILGVVQRRMPLTIAAVTCGAAATSLAHWWDLERGRKREDDAVRGCLPMECLHEEGRDKEVEAEQQKEQQDVELALALDPEGTIDLGVAPGATISASKKSNSISKRQTRKAPGVWPKTLERMKSRRVWMHSPALVFLGWNFFLGSVVGSALASKIWKIAVAPPAEVPQVVPYVVLDNLEPGEIISAIRKRRGGTLLNLDRMLLHSPALCAGWNSFFGAIRGSSDDAGSISLPVRVKEMAICFVGILNRAEYEVYQHEPVFLGAGGTDEQMRAMRACVSFDKGSMFCRPLKRFFTPLDIEVLKLTYHMTWEVQVPTELMAALQQQLGNQQLVELVTTIGAYNGVSRVLVALGINAEGEGGEP